MNCPHPEYRQDECNGCPDYASCVERVSGTDAVRRAVDARCQDCRAVRTLADIGRIISDCFDGWEK